MSWAFTVFLIIDAVCLVGVACVCAVVAVAFMSSDDAGENDKPDDVQSKHETKRTS